MRRYNIINNSLGWLCFVIAAVTYLLTIEPTASFWDCPEFITQGFKLEVGHPPGNPIFMLTARFFVTIFGGGAEVAAIAVNSMSALLSAATILLLFWTITHLTRKLLVRESEAGVSTVKTLLIMGAGLCGSLVYTWSDTFWFSAVEGEVYAFSSFCTALVFWLILKWENRADNPRSDRYLVLIAYIIGISIAVHLLNLLCIPAIVLVIYYKKFRNVNVVGSLLALLLSAVIVALILFGLVPGFVAVAQRFEVFFVNTLGTGYNIGVLVYAVLTVSVFIWTIVMLRHQKSAMGIKFGVLFSVILSGMPFIGHGALIPTILIAAMTLYLFGFCPKVPIRIFNLVILSIFVIFIGYSSYALLLIRSTANTPMNQNAPDNVFALGSYLNREQYGDTPLLTGPKMSETIVYQQAQDENGNIIEYVEVDEQGNPQVRPTVVGPRKFKTDGTIVDKGSDKYTKVVKASTDEPDRYVKKYHDPKYETPDGMSMLFPRMYSDDPRHVSGYKSWSLYSPDMRVYAPEAVRKEWASRGYATRIELERYMNLDNTIEINDPVAVGNALSETTTTLWQPTFWDNLKYFFNYQLNHMYWRYFMWNFAGRQNDIAGNGEPHLGNWISGIPFIDNPRLGDQDLLPEEYTTGNAGHNVFYLLPLIMGVLGLLWQALMNHPGGERKGIEQFWVIFFLFFMTGVAIVLYLNQPPGQPRERDYAFAGSFYAFAIWVGMGVPAIYVMVRKLLVGKAKSYDSPKEDGKLTDMILVGVSVLIGLVVPLQMVSQTWDDHDRSRRYTARDFGMNYLNSLDDNAIIFVNGDNDTFPLWYGQEVEGCRTDVKVVNLSYLSQDWYARQVASRTYDADGVPFYMPFASMDYGNTPYYALPPGTKGADFGLSGDVTAEEMLTNMYRVGKLTPSQMFGTTPPPNSRESSYFMVGGPNINRVYVPLTKETIEKNFVGTPAAANFDFAFDGTSDSVNTVYRWDITPQKYMTGGSPSQFANLVAYDIIARSASEGFERPVYFASTVGDSYYMGFRNNMYHTGMALQVTPFDKVNGDTSPVAAKAYDNIIGRFRWGGIDSGKKIYLDETIRRMVSSTRLAILQVVNDLLDTPNVTAPESARKLSAEKGLRVPATYGEMAQNLMDYMTMKLPSDVAPYENGLDYEVSRTYIRLGDVTHDKDDYLAAKKILNGYVARIADVMSYGKSLTASQRVNMMRNENRNLYYVLTSLSMINYADLQLAALDGKVDSELIAKELFEDLCDVNNLDYQALLMISPMTRAELENYGDAAQDVLMLYDAFDMAGIKPSEGAEKFMRDSRLTANEWMVYLR